MEFLINKQRDLQTRIVKAHTNYKKSPKERITAAYVETRLENIEKLWETFTKTHDELIEQFELKDLYTSSYYKESIYDKTNEVYLDYKCDLKTIMGDLMKEKKVSLLTSASPTSKTPQVKLPKITIPTFTGQYAEWRSFRDMFVSLIHNNTDIENVQKLHYLKAHLAGEAEQLLRHIPITNDTYLQCWTLLDNRYNNKQYLANNILKRFFGQRNVVTESSHAIKELLDTTSETLNALKGLDIDVKSWDIIVIYVVSQKLDAESRKLWESKVSETVSLSNKLPTIDQFKGFLQTRYQALEFLDSKSGYYNRSRYTANHSNYCNFESCTPVETFNNFHINNSPCSYCKGDHKIFNCKGFVGLSVDTRRNYVQSNGLCFNCLGNNHSVKFCKGSSSCQICNRRHHSLLHERVELHSAVNAGSVEHQIKPHVENNLVTRVPHVEDEDQGPTTSITNHFAHEDTRQVLLATAVVEAKSLEQEDRHLLRALIDQGSQASFITSAAVQLLGLKKTAIKGLISGLGGKQTVVSRSTVDIEVISRVNTNCLLKVTAYVLDKLTSYLPSARISITSWPELENINLADPDYDTPNKIDMLLGAEIYAQIIDKGLIKHPSSGSPVAQNTSLGWILSGQVGFHSSISCNVVSMHTQVEQLLKSFWEIESEPSNKSKILSPEEQKCEEFYQATTTRDQNGRYIVRLPFRDERPACVDGHSKEIALKRFHLLEKKLQRDSHLKSEYAKVFREYLELDHMRPLTGKEKEAEGMYLPHHAVVKEDRETTKVRIVFDASCKGTNGLSLNDDLLVGPKLQPELRHIIMRWRMHPICFIADIVKMYRQVKIDERDTRYQRILWRENIEDEIQEYEMKRVTFGTSSAPYLAVKSLCQVAIDEERDFPLAAPRVHTDFYMDDLMSGCQSVQEAVKIYKQMSELLSKCGFILQKWSSNSENMLNEIKKGNLGKELDDKIIMKLEAVNKILGLTWDRTLDEFVYAVQLSPPTTPITKRKAISDISKLYDPLGWIAPSIIKAKILIQKLWQAGIDWDQELPVTLLEEWLSYREELSELTKFRLDRWTRHADDATLVELHGFCDASNAAYAAVVYLRVITAQGGVNVSLITGKTKVAPIKQLSVPRLELNGAVLLAKLLVEVAEVLKISKNNIHAWTDSEIVLAWLSSHPSKWKTFIGNRVSEILTITERNQWAHVRSEHNPADCASRGITPAELIHHQLWKNGPSWLKGKKISYVNPKNLETKLEEKTIKMYLTTAVETANDEDKMWSKFSSLAKLLRVVSYCRRMLKQKGTKPVYLLKEEIDEALIIMIKKFQGYAFKEHVEDLKHGKLKKKSVLTSYYPQIDDQGIIRVGGRLHHANITFEQKHPILLPKSSWLTKLIVHEAHLKTLHGSQALMINYINSKYCILGVKSVVKSYVKKCVPCIRHSSVMRTPLMGQLPSPRVNIARAFLRSGVDYAGPINLRVSRGRGNKSYKGYICLFICMGTRAIHLEAVSELSTQGFLAAFKRFVARRGHCSDMYSDNGSNFIGASKELQHLFNAEKSLLIPEIADWMANNGTKWHFIPPHAPNFGGLWEAGIKSCKFHLKRVIGNSTLTFEEMATILSQIEACLNSRPLSCIVDQGGQMPLTPGHFLVGEPLLLVPDRQYEHTSVTSLRRWQLCQRMLQDFWRRWSQEYLTQFLQRHKWSRVTPEPKIGDIVLVKEPDLPPARWLLGQIVETHPGLDMVTRVVTLRCKNSLIKRPVSRICVLPVVD